jgi:sugar phosphate isomerase/epimerase
MYTNELGIFARTFYRPSVAQYFSAVAQHGLKVVQYNMACAGLPTLPASIPYGLTARIRAAADAHGISIAAISGTFNMIHPDLARRRTGLHGLRHLASACAPLGTRTISLCTGTRDPDDMWRAHPANTEPAAWADLLEAMETALTIADEFDLQLGIEPETANVVDSPASAWRLMQELCSPRVKIILDPANLFQVHDLPRQRAILDEAFDVLGPHVIMAHAKDVREVDGAIHHVAAGTGRLDYAHYLSRLRAVDAPLIVHGLGESEVPASLAFLRAKAAEVKRGVEAAPLGS